MPDYSKQDAFAGYIDAWAALPSRADGADIVPAWCGVDAQSTAEVDAFFVPPTAYFGDKQNGNWDDGTAELMTELGLIVTAAAFNGAAAIYAPRYRQAGQSAQDRWKNFNWQPPPDGDAAAATTDAAMRLAYGDVAAAFSNFSSASDRPFILAAHSQGTLHLKELIRSLPLEMLQERLVAAYLIGNTVEEGELPLPVCATADATGCFVSWNSVVEGGTAGQHWINKTAAGTGAGTPVCVNPLTWEYGDTAPAPRASTAARCRCSATSFSRTSTPRWRARAAATTASCTSTSPRTPAGATPSSKGPAPAACTRTMCSCGGRPSARTRASAPPPSSATTPRRRPRRARRAPRMQRASSAC